MANGCELNESQKGWIWEGCTPSSFLFPFFSGGLRVGNTDITDLLLEYSPSEQAESL